MNELTADSQVLGIMLGVVTLVVLIGLFYDYGKSKKWDKHQSYKQK